MKASSSTTIGGLGSNTFKVSVAGMHSVYTRTTCLQPSGIVVTISQSGSITSSVNTPTTSTVQKHIELNGKFNCAVGDILTIAITTAGGNTSIDQPPSLINTSINIRQGV